MAFVKRIFMKTKMAEKNKSNKKGKSSSTKKKENTNKSASSKTTNKNNKSSNPTTTTINNSNAKTTSSSTKSKNPSTNRGTSAAQKAKFKELGLKIPCWLKCDYSAFHAFKCVGHMTKEQLKEVGLSNHRQKLWRQSGLIKEVFKNQNDGTRIVAYEMTQKGYNVARSEMFMSGFYTPQPRALEHDIKLASDYLARTPEERESWMTETELRNAFIAKVASGEFVKEPGKDYSSCDGAYVDSVSGELIFSEAIGRGYTTAMITAKTNFAGAFGGTIRKY